MVSVLVLHALFQPLLGGKESAVKGLGLHAELGSQLLVPASLKDLLNQLLVVALHPFQALRQGLAPVGEAVLPSAGTLTRVGQMLHRRLGERPGAALASPV